MNGPATSDAEWTPPGLIEKPLEAPALKSQLSAEEQAELERLEKVIRSGWKTFLEVGEALITVSEKRLYRDKYLNFETYCHQELGLSRPYAYTLMDSAEVHQQLSSIEDIEVKPANEAQCRELIRVPQEKRVEAWKMAVDAAGEKPLTAKIIHAAVAKFKPKSAKKSNAAKKKGGLDVKAGLKLIGAIEKLVDDDDTDKIIAKLAELRDWLEGRAKD